MSIALQKLKDAQKAMGSLLSVGLEPCPEYLNPGVTADIQGYKAFLRVIINATSGLVCTYKFNLAFFEALGVEGFKLLMEVREMIPPDVFVIADAKRSDIGSTSRRYAHTIFNLLQADAVTVNPMMGKDSVEPFLEYRDHMTFLLALTSNPGAEDFLLPEKLYRRIAEKAESWNERENIGLVVGATKTSYMSEIRSVAPSLPFLVPGVGAQGGDLAGVLGSGSMNDEFSGLVIHVTRGILPTEEDKGDPREIIQQKTEYWRERISEARENRIFG